MLHTRSGTVQLRELVLVSTICDREAPGAGFSNKWKLYCTHGLEPLSSVGWFRFSDAGS